MGNFFDEAARVLASPVPRRKALRLLGGTAVAGVLAALGVRPASAQVTCSPACKAGETCCPGTGGGRGRGRGRGGATGYCIKADETCCGDKGCKANQQCCPGDGDPFCKTSKKICCGRRTCNQNQRCVDGRCEASNG